MIQWLACGILALSFFAFQRANARVFNFSNENFAAFIGGSFGNGFENTLSSGSNSNAATPVEVNSRHPYNFAGEFGFIYYRKQVSLRFGLEVIRPKDLNDEVGKNASGGELYSVTSETSVWVPKVALEVTLKQGPTSRFFADLGTGYANLAARNSYTFTSTGNSTYGSMEDFYEDMRSSTMMYEGSVGYESLFTDATTVLIQGGYRYLNFTDIKHNRDITTFQGAVSKGDRATNTDGSNRSLNLSGFYIGLGLRFWIQ